MVAGVDAGKVFNTWPLMNGSILPVDYWKPELGWRNFFENMSTVQFNHRAIAYFTFTSVCSMLFLIVKPGVPRNLKVAMSLLVGFTNLQVVLGIWMLLQSVPVEKGVAHQLNGIVVLSLVVYLLAATNKKSFALSLHA